ncbi:hypothetical protein [Kribbella sp. DT2]|uniref:hypothetical protein n=1 Tax=Kribbella sp. DT2 TaxID=3393427 RepID=UPI003CF1A322
MTKLLVAAPALFVAYGTARLIDGIDGSHGPGPAWTVGHVLFLIAFVLYAGVLLHLRRLVGDRPVARPLATVATVVGLIGVLAFLRVTVIDLIVGFRAADRPEMSRLGGEYDRWPGNLGLYEPLHTVGPLLFLIGLLTLAILLATARKLPAWSPVVLVLGFVAITANLDLMPLGGLLLLIAILPLTRAARPAGKTAVTI